MNKEYSTILVLVLAFLGVFIYSDEITLLYLAVGIGVVSLLFPWVAKKHTFFVDETVCITGIGFCNYYFNPHLFFDHSSSVVHRKAYRQEIYYSA